MDNKVLIFSAPSGAGKSTIIQHIIKKFPNLEFSISATSRKLRGNEEHGIDYYFITNTEFSKLVENNEFIEWEEVYAETCYGTLKSEVERIWNKQNIVVFDIDVVGGVNVKKLFGENALSIFIQPPSINELKNRLTKRNTDTPLEIEKRINKAEEEMQYKDKFDVIIINDNLQVALEKAEEVVGYFINE